MSFRIMLNLARSYLALFADMSLINPRFPQSIVQRIAAVSKAKNSGAQFCIKSARRLMFNWPSTFYRRE